MSHPTDLENLFDRLQVSIFSAVGDANNLPGVNADWKIACSYLSSLGNNSEAPISQAISVLAHDHMWIARMAEEVNAFEENLIRSVRNELSTSRVLNADGDKPGQQSIARGKSPDLLVTSSANEHGDDSSALREWFLINLHYPFPTPSEKSLLRSKTGTSDATLKTYFTNLRRRCGWNSNLAILGDGKKEVLSELIKRVMRGDDTVDAGEKESIQRMVDYVQGKFEYNKVGDWLKKVIEEPLPARVRSSPPAKHRTNKKARMSSLGESQSSPSLSHRWKSESVSSFATPLLSSSPTIPSADSSPDSSGEDSRRRKLPQTRIPSFPTSLRSVSSSSIQSSLSNISFALNPTLEVPPELTYPGLCTEDAAGGSSMLSNNAWQSTMDHVLQGFQEGGFMFGALNSMNLNYEFNPSLQNLEEVPPMPDFPVYLDSMSQQPFFFTSPSYLPVTTNEFDFGFDLLHPSTSTTNSTLAITTNPPEAPRISTSTLPLYLPQPSVLVESPIEITPSSESATKLTPNSIIRDAKSLPPTRTKRKQVIYYSDPSVDSSLYPRSAIATSNLGLGEEKNAGQWEDVDVSREGEVKKAKMSKSTGKTTTTPNGKNGKK